MSESKKLNLDEGKNKYSVQMRNEIPTIKF